MPKDYEKLIDRAFANYKTRCARYAHLLDEPMREGVERVAEVFANAGRESAEVVDIVDRGLHKRKM